MDLRLIFISNGVGIYLMFMLQFVSKTRIRRRRVEDKVFGALLYGVMLCCAMEMFSYLIDGKVYPGFRILNYAANTYLFSVNLLLPFLVLVYIDLSLYEDSTRIWKHYKGQIIIGIIMLFMTVLNLFVPISFYITKHNVYERRPFSYTYYFVILYFCICALALTWRYNRENGAKAFLSINLFMVPILIGAALQFMFYGLSLAWLSAAIGLTGLYMMQQNEFAYIDPLVETYNRQYLNQIVTAWSNRGIHFSGVMMDLDYFKDINDKYGHSEGDRALKNVTDILKESRLDREWVFRFAGDEFIILKMTQEPDSMQEYLSRVEERVEAFNRGRRKYLLSLSYGLSFCDSGDIDAFIKEMDEQMYQMKAQHHIDAGAGRA